MGGDGIEASDPAHLTEGTLEVSPRRGCLAEGCGCTDPRIVSPRRARFHAYLARARGQTADRVIAPDPEWHLPASANEEN
jgi:hypothetical protein